jgi:hypothetical protein
MKGNTIGPIVHVLILDKFMKKHQKQTHVIGSPDQGCLIDEEKIVSTTKSFYEKESKTEESKRQLDRLVRDNNGLAKWPMGRIRWPHRHSTNSSLSDQWS